jgi:hypothetical protein
MKSPNLESLYITIRKSILLTESFTEFMHLARIIKMCRLKPYDYLLKRDERIILYNQWIDEYGNSLNLINKNINIIYGDLNITNHNCTDIYYGLSINKIIKFAKLTYISYGLDEDLHTPCTLISFLGTDEYLRTYMYMYDTWTQVSPLMIGLLNLQNIAANFFLSGLREIKYDINLPCSEKTAWIISMPITSDFLKTLQYQCNVVYQLFKGELNDKS